MFEEKRETNTLSFVFNFYFYSDDILFNWSSLPRVCIGLCTKSLQTQASSKPATIMLHPVSRSSAAEVRNSWDEILSVPQQILF